MQSTKAPHGVRHIRISTAQQPQQDDAIFDYPAQLRNNHNAFCARVSTLVYRMISQHVSSPMAASRFLKFPNGSHTHHEGFSGKPLHWPTDKNHSHLITHHGHVTETSNRAPQKANHGRRPASKKALTRVDSARANLLGLVCHGHPQRMNCSQKGGLVYAVSGKSAKRRQT